MGRVLSFMWLSNGEEQLSYYWLAVCLRPAKMSKSIRIWWKHNHRGPGALKKHWLFPQAQRSQLKNFKRSEDRHLVSTWTEDCITQTGSIKNSTSPRLSKLETWSEISKLILCYRQMLPAMYQNETSEKHFSNFLWPYMEEVGNLVHLSYSGKSITADVIMEWWCNGGTRLH